MVALNYADGQYNATKDYIKPFYENSVGGLVADEKMDCINELDYYRRWRSLGNLRYSLD